MCITAAGNILASGNLCFRVFKLQLKVINKNVCYLYSARVNQIIKVILPLVTLFSFKNICDILKIA